MANYNALVLRVTRQVTQEKTDFMQRICTEFCIYKVQFNIVRVLAKILLFLAIDGKFVKLYKKMKLTFV